MSGARTLTALLAGVALLVAAEATARAEDAGTATGADAGAGLAADRDGGAEPGDGGADGAVAQADGGRPGPSPRPIPAERLPRLEARLETDSIELGAIATLRIDVSMEAGDRVHLKGVRRLGPFEVADRRREELSGEGGPRERLFLDLQAFETGDLDVPPVELMVVLADGRTGEVRTPPFHLRVTDPLANESAPEPRPDRPPRPVLTTERRILWTAGVLAAVLVAGLIGLGVGQLTRRRKPRPAPPPPPPRPPEEVALEKLEALRSGDLLDRGEVKEFHIGVSEAVREYLGGRYRFDSLELTTEELLAEVDRATLRGVTREELVAFLRETDMVKFAKWRPDVVRSEALLASAFDIVRRTTQAELVARASTVRPAGRTDGAA